MNDLINMFFLVIIIILSILFFQDINYKKISNLVSEELNKNNLKTI